eukprot:scaffold16664_cov161-Amphora_coffeaeformis.AAC.1
MDLFYGIHPPSEVHVPESMYPIETRSRSPSPLSLRDPQDDGDYQQGGSSDEEDKGTRPAVPQRPARPMPLSIAASLDLPSLSHPRRHRSPDLARRSLRRVGTTDSSQNNANIGEGEGGPSLIKTAETTTPVKSEAPFDEAFTSPSQVLSEETPLPHSLIATAPNPILTTKPSGGSFSAHISHVATTSHVLAYDVGEPPACELQEPPSLTTFHRRPLSSAMPPVTSPPPSMRTQQHGIYSTKGLAGPLVDSAKSLPFEDECDEDPTLREGLEEKKTNDPGLRGPSRDVSVGQLTSIYEQYLQKTNAHPPLAASVTKQTLNLSRGSGSSLSLAQHLLARNTSASRTQQHDSDNIPAASYPTRQTAADPPATYWRQKVPSNRSLDKSNSTGHAIGLVPSTAQQQRRSQANDAPGISYSPAEHKKDPSDAGSVTSLPSLRNDYR